MKCPGCGIEVGPLSNCGRYRCVETYGAPEMARDFSIGKAGGNGRRRSPAASMRYQDFAYPGGKGLAGVYQWIIGKFPPHVWYVEPFAGKAAIFRRKPPALRSYLIERDENVVAWLRQLPGTIVHHGDGTRWLELAAEWLPPSPDVLVYCDPPYLPETRTKKKLYRHEMSEADHIRFLQAVLRLRCQVAVSGYWSPLYDGALTRWQRFEHPAITRGGVMRTEVLWTNYDPADSPGMAMEYFSLGDNFRERERVARKANRWVSRLQQMGARERRAILLAILDGTAEGRVYRPKQRVSRIAEPDDEDLNVSGGDGNHNVAGG